MKKIILYMLALTAVAGCSKVPEQTPISGEAIVTFDVTLPPQKDVNSRAFTDTDVANIDVLIFDHDAKFIERVKIDQITGADREKKFSLRMNFTLQPRTFHIIANGRDPVTDADRINFNDLSSSMAEATAIPQLRTIASAITEATITPLVMWGRVTVASINSTIINISDAKLLRSVAAITVSKDASVTNFTLSETSLYGVPDYGSVAPAGYTSSATVPTTPSVPAGVQHMNGYAKNGQTPVLYLYERKNTAADHLSIIILGIYGGQQRYYRVVLADENKNFMDVVRNHRYNVKIVKAEGYGYSSPEDALANPPSNLKVEITDDIDINFLIVADGGHELGVSVNHVELWGANTNAQEELATVYSSRGMPGITIQHSAFTGGSYSPYLYGTYRLTAGWNTATTATGTIIVTDGKALSQTITLVTKPITGYITDTGYSYVYKLFDETNKPWSVKVVANTDRARLSQSTDAVNFLGNPDWGLSSMESRTNSAAYLHLLKTGAIAEIEYSCIDGTGSLRVGRLIISQ